VSKREERRLTLSDQADARSIKAASLHKAKKRLPKNSEHVNPYFKDLLKLIYDRKERKVILGSADLCEKSDRFIALSPSQAVIIKAVKKATAGFKDKITAADLILQEDIHNCSVGIIGNILKSLVKEKILEEEEIEIRDQKISAFKLR